MTRVASEARLTAIRNYSTENCYYFNGIDNYIEIPDNDILSIATTGEITISAWLKLVDTDFPNTTYSADGPYIMWLGKGQFSPTKYEYGFRLYGKSGSPGSNTPRPNRRSFYVFNDTGGTGVGSFFQESVILGEWVHIVGAVDATSTYIWKNGVLKDTDIYTASITPVNTTAPFRIGSVEIDSGSDPGYLKGFVRDIRVWNRKLTDTEVTNIYNGVNIVSGLVANWPLNEKSSTTVSCSISGLTGVVYGATPSNGNLPITRQIVTGRTVA